MDPAYLSNAQEAQGLLENKILKNSRYLNMLSTHIETELKQKSIQVVEETRRTLPINHDHFYTKGIVIFGLYLLGLVMVITSIFSLFSALTSVNNQLIIKLTITSGILLLTAIFIAILASAFLVVKHLDKNKSILKQLR